MITGRYPFLETEVQPLLAQFLAERGLALSPYKTKITHFEAGCDFLGQNIRKHQGKLLITPARKNLKAFLTKVRTTISANQQATAGSSPSDSIG